MDDICSGIENRIPYSKSAGSPQDFFNTYVGMATRADNMYHAAIFNCVYNNLCRFPKRRKKNDSHRQDTTIS